MTRPGIELRSLGPLANTLTIMPMSSINNYNDCLKTRKTVEHEGDRDINCKWRAWNRLQRFGKGVGSVGNGRINRDHANYSIVEIG